MPRLFGLRCWLKKCPCTIGKVGNDWWAVCTDCDKPRRFLFPGRIPFFEDGAAGED